MKMDTPIILVYITSDKDRVMGGDPLTLYIPDEKEREQCIYDLAHALKADVVKLRNGDQLIINHIY